MAGKANKMDNVVASAAVPGKQAQFREPVFATTTGLPGVKIKFGMEVNVKDEHELPNGTYFTGGPMGVSLQTLYAYVPGTTTGRQLQIAIHEEMLKRIGESMYTKTSGPTGTKMSAVKHERIGPNKIQANLMLNTCATAEVYIAVQFRGGPISLEGPVKGGDGYEVIVLQNIRTFHKGFCIVS